jgi:hypothetical protein
LTPLGVSLDDSLLQLIDETLAKCTTNLTLVDEMNRYTVLDHRSAAVSGFGRAQQCQNKKNHVIQVNDVGYPGLSGSPCVTEDGLLVGIYTARRTSGNFATRRAKVATTVACLTPASCNNKFLGIVQQADVPCDLVTPLCTNNSAAAFSSHTTQLPTRTKEKVTLEDLATQMYAMNARLDQMHASTNARLDQTNARLDQMHASTNAQFEALRGELADQVRRLGMVLSLVGGVRGLEFVAWGKDASKTVHNPVSIHAFDSFTDCDYGSLVLCHRRCGARPH